MQEKAIVTYQSNRISLKLVASSPQRLHLIKRETRSTFDTITLVYQLPIKRWKGQHWKTETDGNGGWKHWRDAQSDGYIERSSSVYICNTKEGKGEPIKGNVWCCRNSKETQDFTLSILSKVKLSIRCKDLHINLTISEYASNTSLPFEVATDSGWLMGTGQTDAQTSIQTDRPKRWMVR